MKNTIIINGACVEYEFFEEDLIINDGDGHHEHVERSLQEGYREGELVSDNGRGWWRLLLPF
jgi:hypothetical protein